MKVGANIFLVAVHLLQMEIELPKSFFNPSHEFLLHNVARDSKVGQLFIVSFSESIAIEAVIVWFTIKIPKRGKSFYI
jgi:hypothetical protein